jgi:hypothetical protein
MPSANTFSIPPIAALLDRYLVDVVVADPFARNSARAEFSNDLNPQTSAIWHMDASEFCAMLHDNDVSVNVVLFDPPYSPRQISECYAGIGRQVTQKDTQNAHLYKSVKDGLDRILRPGGVAICFGWNSGGFGTGRGYTLEEILLVPHGGAHNDTIVTVERKA